MTTENSPVQCFCSAILLCTTCISKTPVIEFSELCLSLRTLLSLIQQVGVLLSFNPKSLGNVLVTLAAIYFFSPRHCQSIEIQKQDQQFSQYCENVSDTENLLVCATYVFERLQTKFLIAVSSESARNS